MDKPRLNDPERFPDDEVLRGCLGRAKGTWDAFLALLAECDPAISGQWRYYKDGKS